MSSKPHILIANFERRVLWPLNLAYYAAVIYYLWHRSWLLGIAIFALSLGVGAIGQGLAHRKHETLAELARGKIIAGGHKDELSFEDGGSLSRACVYTVVLVCITAPVVLWHQGWKWYWILLVLAVALPLLPISFMALAAGPLRILRIFWRRRPAE